jgi:hypothetical protein
MNCPSRYTGCKIEIQSNVIIIASGKEIDGEDNASRARIDNPVVGRSKVESRRQDEVSVDKHRRISSNSF